MHKRTVTAILTLMAVCLLTWPASGSNLANPGGMLPPGRISIGASYHLGGYTITDSALGCLLNRFHARIGYSPLQYVDVGIDLGATQMSVDSITVYNPPSDTTGTHYVVFDGKYGFSGGLNVKGATPRFFNDMMAVFGMVQATIFSSTNSAGAEYSGVDGAGALGLQFKIPKFGYITAGAKMYYIEGDNKSYTGLESYYSNTDNLAGWITLDFIPTFKQQIKGNPYFSAEMTIMPGMSMGGSVPLQGITFSFAVGWVSPRLYGEDFEDVR